MAAQIKTPIGDAPIIPVVMLMIGGYLAWFGVHYFKSDQKWPTDPIKSVLRGGQPTTASYYEESQRQSQDSAYVAQAAATTGAAAAGGIAALAAGGLGGIAAAAQKYIGAGYVYGGNASSPGQWDCSSFVSYVLGHDLGLTLPGGGHWGDPGYPPNAHGPTTTTYALYGTALNASQVQAGDLVVWSTHMGIATDNANIVSARDEAEGTGMSTIAGTSTSLGESPNFRRVPLS